MTEYVGKLIPGVFCAFLGTYGLIKIVDPSIELVCILGFMVMWGISTAHPETLNAIDDIHRWASTKIGVVS